jgi:hypothetical protein
VTQVILGTAVSYGETITSTGAYTTTFALGSGPSMSPEESLLIQGIKLDTQLVTSLRGFTGYQNGGLYEVKATYDVLATAGRFITFPVVAGQYCYYGTYNFSA